MTTTIMFNPFETFRLLAQKLFFQKLKFLPIHIFVSFSLEPHFPFILFILSISRVHLGCKPMIIVELERVPDLAKKARS